jgi:hypothetical protein
MNYTYEIITNNNSSIIKRTDIDGNISWVPLDSDNPDYQAYLKSLEDEA